MTQVDDSGQIKSTLMHCKGNQDSHEGVAIKVVANDECYEKIDDSEELV